MSINFPNDPQLNDVHTEGLYRWYWNGISWKSLNEGISGYSGYSGISGYSGYSGISGYSGYSGISGYSGWSGISGYSGYSGYSGISGYSSFSGISGYSGYSGISGYSGWSGISGYSGATGPQGTSGWSGISGYSGYSGISGYSGWSGISGYSGYSSFSGISGYSGWSGISGYSGWSGISGYSGYSGYSGISGYSGWSGISGYSGYSGISGYSGPAGPSNVLNSTAVTTAASFYPVFVAGAGNNTPSIRTTATAFIYTPSTGRLQTTQEYVVNSLGVGTTPSGTAGEIRATNNVTAYYSDERLKNFEGTIDNALDKVLSLNGYYFRGNQTAKEFGYDTTERQVGVSAQEVERVLPEVVTEAPINENYLTVYYEKLVPLLIEAIKEQNTIIKAQEDKLNTIMGLLSKNNIN